MKTLSMVSVLVAAVLAGAAPGCTDRGDPLPAAPAAPGLTAVPPAVTVGPGSSVSVVISGGTPPYVIAAAPDTSLVSALLRNPTTTPETLVITGVTVASAAGSTSVRVVDGSPDPLGVTVPITKLP